MFISHAIKTLQNIYSRKSYFNINTVMFDLIKHSVREFLRALVCSIIYTTCLDLQLYQCFTDNGAYLTHTYLILRHAIVSHCFLSFSPCMSHSLREKHYTHSQTMTLQVSLLVYCWLVHSLYEPRHEISNNVVCATSKGSDQPAHTNSLIRAFASRLNILWVLSYWPNNIWSF